MCFSKELSLRSFLVGIISSIILIIFGNKDKVNQNKAIGYFTMYISLAQIIDYFIWSDINCKNNINKLISKIGPIIIYLQPIIYGLLLNYYIISNNTIPNNILIISNIIYIFYYIQTYNKYLDKNKKDMCSKLDNNKHISWLWSNEKSLNNNLYFIFVLLNINNFIYDKEIRNFNIILLIFFLIAYYKYNNVFSEIWCYISVSIPLIILLLQKIE